MKSCFIAAFLLFACLPVKGFFDDLYHQLLNKWGNTYTEIDYDDGGHGVIRPNGFIDLKGDFRYQRISNGDELYGTWKFTNDRQLILDGGTNMERVFDILHINKDSLVIRRRDGNVTYTQHYVVYNNDTGIVNNTKSGEKSLLLGKMKK